MDELERTYITERIEDPTNGPEVSNYQGSEAAYTYVMGLQFSTCSHELVLCI